MDFIDLPKNKKTTNHRSVVFRAGLESHFVGVPGFEPGTPWSQTRCASRAALHPEKILLTLMNAT